jgi:hypothetical protein
MSRRLAGCAARLGKTASLPCATQHSLQAFWTSCHLRRMDQSILQRRGSCRRRRMRPRVLAGRHGRPSRAGRRGGHGGKRRWAARVAFSHCRQWSSCTAKTVSRQPLTRCERGMEPAAGRKVCVGSWEAPRAPHPHHGHRQWPQISLRTAYRTPRSGRTPPLVFSVSGPGPRLASVRRTHPRHVASDALAQSTA